MSLAEADPSTRRSARRHVPELAVEWALTHPAQTWRYLDGTLCFADISGFTALAERLAQRGRAGGEELVETLGAVFTTMIGIARERGGSLLKFGGDALLLFFRGRDHARQAASAAVEMRRALKRASDLPTSVGPLHLSMSVGLHSGEALFLLVGGLHRELMILGPAIDLVLAAEGRAKAGEIALSTATVAALPTGAAKLRGDGQPLLRWRQPIVQPCGAQPEPAIDDAAIGALLPRDLEAHLAPGTPDPEHRIACIAFACLSGTGACLDQQGPAALADAVQRTLEAAQNILVDEGVTLLAVDCDRDGAKLFMAAGVPNAHEDNEGVMLRAMRRLVEAPLPLQIQVGVSRGPVFAAEVGDPRRAAYSAMGDTTNTAARIAAKAPPGSILAHPATLDECLIRFSATAAEPLRLKGKRSPLVVYQVGREIGLRHREGLDVTELVGREDEALRLHGAVASLAGGHGASITVVGPAGIGKTRLLADVTRQPTALGSAVNVLALRSEPYGATMPYRMFRDPLRAALGIEPGESQAAALRAGIAAVAPKLEAWLPLVADLVDVPVDPTPEVLAIESRFRSQRIAHVLADLLSGLRAGPWLVAIDDAHWCDDASTQLLERMTEECGRRGWMMLAARRDTAGGFEPPGSERLALPAMPDEQIERLILSATEAAPLRPHETATVVARAGGNPLFALEAVRAMREVGSLDAVPASLQGAMASRIDALDRSARQVLQFASVLGQSFSPGVLEELLEGEGHAFSPTTLARLEEFIESDGDAHHRIRSVPLRDTVYEGIAYRLRKRLHAAAGRVIERRAQDRRSAADLLTLHFSRAGDAARTWHYGGIAGDRARDRYANADAAHLYSLALEAARKLDDVDDADRIRVWRELGYARLNAGLLEDALDAQRRALKLAGSTPLPRAEALYHLARTMDYGARLSGALRHLSSARHLLADRQDAPAIRLRAQVESLRAVVLQGLDRPAAVLVQSRIAAQLAEQADDPASLARSLAAMELAHLQLKGPGDGHGLRQALAIYDQIGDVAAQAGTLGNLGVIAAIAGRWDEAAEAFDAARALRSRSGNAIEAALAARNLGELLFSQGRLDEAETVLTEALRVMQASRWSEGVAVVQTLVGHLFIERGLYAEADAILSAAAAEFVGLGQPLTALETVAVQAAGLTAAGEPQAGLELLDAAIAAAGGDLGMLVPRVALIAGLALARAGHRDAALERCTEGWRAACRFGLPYDEALLAQAATKLAQTHGPDRAGLEASMAKLADLGVVKPPRSFCLVQ